MYHKKLKLWQSLLAIQDTEAIRRNSRNVRKRWVFAQRVTYINLQQQLLVTTNNKPFQLIHQWCIRIIIIATPHVSASHPESIRSLAFALTFFEVKTAFVLYCTL